MQWAATRERLTRETFARYRKVGGSVIPHSNTEEVLRVGVADRLPMFSSDGGRDLDDNPTHPHVPDAGDRRGPAPERHGGVCRRTAVDQIADKHEAFVGCGALARTLARVEPHRQLCCTAVHVADGETGARPERRSPPGASGDVDTDHSAGSIEPQRK